MKRIFLTTLALGLALAGQRHPAEAQPAKGASAALERVRDVMAERFKEAKLGGDPDRDFAELLIASYEETLFLAKAQLEYGGDRQLREVAQKIQDEQQGRIDALKEWRVRSGQPDYRAKPNQTPSGQGPLDLQAQAGAPAGRTPPAAPAPAPEKAPAAPPTANTPLVSGTVKKLDEASGKVTLDHEPIPNIDMDAMTMAYKVQDPAMLKGLKTGEKVRFSADRVNGALAITRIQKAK